MQIKSWSKLAQKWHWNSLFLFKYELLVIDKLIYEFKDFVKINDDNGLSNIVNFPATEIANSDEMFNYLQFLKNNRK